MTKKILIVDDNEDDQMIICYLFKKSQIPFIPTYALSLDDAKQKLLEEKFDVVTLDGLLSRVPVKSFGFELIPSIRNSESKDAKIIMLSGVEEYVQQGLSLGADVGYPKSLLSPRFKFDTNLNLIPN